MEQISKFRVMVQPNQYINIRHISGPISFYIIDIKYKSYLSTDEIKKTIYLFGDSHFTKLNSCNSCDQKADCYRIDKFFDLIFENNKQTPIDFFLEISWIDKMSKTQPTSKDMSFIQKYTSEQKATKTGYLFDLRDKYYNCIYNNQNCFPNTRIHYTDFRHLPDNLPVFGHLVRLLYTGYLSEWNLTIQDDNLYKILILSVLLFDNDTEINTFFRELFEIYIRPNFVNNIVQFINNQRTIIDNKLKKIMPGLNINAFKVTEFTRDQIKPEIIYKHTDGQEYHKIYKQLLMCSEDNRNKIVDQARSDIGFLMKQYCPKVTSLDQDPKNFLPKLDIYLQLTEKLSPEKRNLKNVMIENKKVSEIEYLHYYFYCLGIKTLDYTSILFDCYTLGRILKESNDIKQSSNVFIFAGGEHILHYFDFFRYKLAGNVTVNIPSQEIGDDHLRCLELSNIDHVIDLTNEQKIQSGGNLYNKKYLKYKSQYLKLKKLF